MRRALVVLLAAGCGASGPPSGFGVDITVDGTAISAAERARVTGAELFVTGDEPYSTALDLAKPLQHGTVHFQYIPSIHSGTLDFALEVRDSSGAAVASGTSGDVTLSDGHAAQATIVLMAGGLVQLDLSANPDLANPDLTGIGAACQKDGECPTGHCVDGVCCDTACTGTCQSCALPASKGICSPYAAGSDPEYECAAKVAAYDGGVVDAGDYDAGDGGQLNLPDGSAGRMPSACGGSCSGSAACAYPDNTHACGPQFCNTATERVRFLCTGSGGCEPELVTCSDYICAAGDCKTSCSAHSDCQSTDYCNGTTNKCVTKKAVGLTCTASAECGSGFCVASSRSPGTSYCCNSSCSDTGMTCDNPGTEGICSCTGKTSCASGCQLFYLDADGDHHGDPTGTIANGRAVADCIGQSSVTVSTKTYYPAGDDCDDADPRVFPGQTAYFGTINTPADSPRSNGSWDFDCDGHVQKARPEYTDPQFAGGCAHCGLTGGSSVGWSCIYYAGGCGTGDYPGVNSDWYGFNCGFFQPDGAGGYRCASYLTAGFVANIDCDKTGTYHVCGKCDALPVDSTSTEGQGCH